VRGIANRRKAAVVGGVDVHPVRSLLDVIHFVNSGNGMIPLKADGNALLNKSQEFLVDFKDKSSQGAFAAKFQGFRPDLILWCGLTL
jgi:hypothetical protein